MFSDGVTAERSFSAGGPQPATAAAAPEAATILKKFRRSIGFIDALYPCASPSLRRGKETQRQSAHRHPPLRSHQCSLRVAPPRSYEPRLVSCLAERQTAHRGGASTSNHNDFPGLSLVNPITHKNKVSIRAC